MKLKSKVPIQKPYLPVSEIERMQRTAALAKAKTVSVIGKAQLLKAVMEVPNKKLHRIRLLLSDGRLWWMMFDYRNLTPQAHAERIQRVIINIKTTAKRAFEEVP